MSINLLLRALRLTCPHEYQEFILCLLRMHGNINPRKAFKLCTIYPMCALTIVKLRPRNHNDITVKIKLQPQAQLQLEKLPLDKFQIDWCPPWSDSLVPKRR